MKRAAFLSLIVLCVLTTLQPMTVLAANDKVVIAHRGASGYLSEHTLPAMAMAYALGADYIEQDLVLTKDGIPIVIHDIYLDSTTNVREVFPDRARSNGKYYAVDFTLEEIKSLEAHERVTSSGQPVYPGRFPKGNSKFEIPTFVEAIELVLGLNKSTGRNVGIYPELKASKFHRDEGYNFEEIILEILEEYGYNAPDANIYVQSFEADSLKRLKELGCKAPMVQLIGGGASYNIYVTDVGLDEIATYAAGIGPTTTRIEDKYGRAVDDYSLVRRAHERGLVVHPYTMRADQMPLHFDSFEEMLKHYYFTIGVDGLFTDFTDLAVKVLKEGS
jgi:glycerophosphoryl diester phosphodiesterase